MQEKMSMRKSRGGYRHGRQHAHAHHVNDDHLGESFPSGEPLHQDRRQQHHASSSSSAPTYSRNNRGPGLRNGGHRQHPKFRFVKKSELLPNSNSDSDPSAVAVAVAVAADHVNERVASLTVADDEDIDVTPENHYRQNSVVGAHEEEDISSKIKERDNNNDDNIMDRLDRLLSHLEEPELSEAQLKDNDQLQENELLVVESIYGENYVNLERWKGLRCFQIQICIEVSGEISITAKLNSSNEHETVTNNSDDFLCSFEVQYLPPIVLTCLLPRSYPSHQPPILTISVQWLESLKASSLCSKLDSIWEEQQGQEVIYQWVEWLHGSSLYHLGYDKEITLGPYGMNYVGDKRAVSGTISPDHDIPLLKSYNSQKHHENFLKELHECSICYGEYPGTKFVWLPCKHFFCLKCLQTFTQMHVKEGTVGNLQCPEAKCVYPIPPSILKHLLGDKEYEYWESMMLEKKLASMSDVVYCPRCETPCIEDKEQHAQCSKCFFSFCTLCRERRHVGIACMPLDMKLQILQDRQNSSQLKEDQKLREREMINEMLSLKEIQRDSKLCPSCDMAISRTEGCNKMKCSNCGQYFCYRCNKAIDESDPYGHFRDGSCELFPQEMIETWQERVNHRQVVGQIQAELFPECGRACPSCRQFNAKIGNNNHLFCWACQSHYCYLCNEIVRRGTKHYGPKGCKQHTEG